MSEFSESCHLASLETATGIALLERAGVSGWVFPAVEGWVTVVVDADFSGQAEWLLSPANEGVMLAYVNAEDHGWGFAVFDGPNEVSRYTCNWEDDIEFDDSKLDRDRLAALVPAAIHLVTSGTLEPATIEDAFDVATLENPGHRAARILGIRHVKWISGEYLRTGAPAHAIPVNRA